MEGIYGEQNFYAYDIHWGAAVRYWLNDALVKYCFIYYLLLNNRGTSQLYGKGN